MNSTKNKSLSNKEVKDKLPKYKKIFEEEIGFKDLDDFVQQTLDNPVMRKLVKNRRLYTFNKELSRYDKDPDIDKIFKDFNVHDERVINFGNSLEKDGIIYNYNSGKIFLKKRVIKPSIYPNYPNLNEQNCASLLTINSFKAFVTYSTSLLLSTNLEFNSQYERNLYGLIIKVNMIRTTKATLSNEDIQHLFKGQMPLGGAIEEYEINYVQPKHIKN